MMGKNKWAVALLVVVLAGVSACSTDDSGGSGTVKPGPDRRTATVTPEAGGVLKSADGRLVITIPPGAVSAPKELWVESVPTAKAELDFPDAIPKGVAYELGPEGQEFAVPASAELTLGLAEVPTSAKGMPAMALFSRSAAKGDEVLASTGTLAPDGTPFDGSVVTNTQDETAGVVRIGGEVHHFSQAWAKSVGDLWVSFEHTAKPQQKVGDEWSATLSVSNQGDAKKTVVQAYSSTGTFGSVEVIMRGSACGNQSSKYCEAFTGTQINPAGTDILPGSGLSLQPPARYRCAKAGASLFSVSFVLPMITPNPHFLTVVRTRGVTCTDDGKLANGAACTLGSACSSGNCVDGVCCDTTCTGTCQACNLQGSEGKCTNVPSGQPHPGSCPSPKLCNGNGACLLPNGQLCLNGASECQSGICRDMYCCDTACTGMCTQCDVPGSEGTCTNVPSGGIDPDGCFSPDKCDGNGTCLKAPATNGTACASAAECQSGFCVDGVCCNQKCAGECMACIASKSRTADGICSAVKEDKNPDNECPGKQTCQAYSSSPTATAYCNAHYGDPCTVNAVPFECPGAGACRDGVCCNMSNCTMSVAPCSACTTAHTGLANGTCGTVLAGQDPFNSCAGASVCNGSGSCM